MGQLKPLQEELRQILFIGSNRESSRFWSEGLPKRLQVYRNTVHGNAYETLDSDYPLTRKQFSEDDWFELEKSYFTQCPPDFWELNNCVLAFPKYLKSQKEKPWIVELADYERAELQTFVHKSEVRKGLGKTNPTVLTRVFQHQLSDWIFKKSPSAKPPIQKPEVLVFYRDSDHQCHVRLADPLLLLILDHFKNGSADLEDLEPVRKKLLPNNTVPLKKILENLVLTDLILL